MIARGHELNLRLNLAGETIPSAEWVWDSGPLRDYDLVVVHEGKGTYSGSGESWNVSRGSCMFFRRGEAYLGRQEPESPVAMYFIHLDFLDVKKRPVDPPADVLLPLHFKVDRFEFVQGLAHAVVEGVREAARTGQWAEADVWMHALWLELKKQARRPRWYGLEREQADLVDELCREIRDHIGDHWRLADIATRLGCGVEHAGRLFRKYRGVSPGDFVVQARIEAARGLLNSSSLSIGQVAEVLGYCDVYAFSRQFKAKTGQSPRAFRLA